jgi:hypothetical protein
LRWQQFTNYILITPSRHCETLRGYSRGNPYHHVFAYLKKELPGTLDSRIKWNFTKFLVTSEGKPFKRYAPTVKPLKIEKDILKLLENRIYRLLFDDVLHLHQ